VNPIIGSLALLIMKSAFPGSVERIAGNPVQDAEVPVYDCFCTQAVLLSLSIMFHHSLLMLSLARARRTVSALEMYSPIPYELINNARLKSVTKALARVRKKLAPPEKLIS
jgi:hypothetical protein